MSGRSMEKRDPYEDPTRPRRLKAKAEAARKRLRRFAIEAPLGVDRARLLSEALLYTGGNVAQAARLAGMEPGEARRLVREDEELRQALAEARSATQERLAAVLRPWEALAPLAQATLVEALQAEQVTYVDGEEVRTPLWKVRLAAAKEILDRAYGKPTTTIQAEIAEKDALDPLLARRAMAAWFTMGLPAVAAVEWARRHPEEADRLLQGLVEATRELASPDEPGAEPPTSS